MCDTLCGLGPEGMIFAKNSDRPAGEVQLTIPFGRRNTQGCTLRTQYLHIGDTGAHAALLSCPTWLWGAEHGVNEYGVAIGNEKVSTTNHAAQARPALIGMDLVRLALERARTAREALAIMTELLEVHGQGGLADAVHQEAYDSSFLIADAEGAFILDTAGSTYAAAPFPGGTAISNRLTLRTEWTLGSPSLEDGEDFDRYRDPEENTAYADVRLAASRRFLDDHRSGGLTAAAMAAHLRDHGAGPWGAPGAGGPAQPPPTDMARDFSDVTVCMHAGDYSVTTASLIAVLPADRASGRTVRAFVALGSPCTSVYVPSFPSTVGGPPGFVPRQLWREDMWRAADAVRVHVQADPDAIHAVRAVLNPIEDDLWREADDVLDFPERWAEVGGDWGQRALNGLLACVS